MKDTKHKAFIILTNLDYVQRWLAVLALSLVLISCSDDQPQPVESQRENNMSPELLSQLKDPLPRPIYYPRAGETKDIIPYNVGAATGMIELYIRSWGPKKSGRYNNGIKLRIINTVTKATLDATTENGYFSFTGLQPGHYQLDSVDFTREGYSLSVKIYEYFYVKPGVTIILPRIVYSHGLRIVSDKSEIVEGRSVKIAYPPGQPQSYFSQKFKDKEESNYYFR